MSLPIFFAVVSVALGFAGHFVYIRGIIRGKVKPHAFTWFVWGILTAVAYAAQVVGGGGPGSWVTGVTSLLCFLFAAIGLGKSSRVFITNQDWIIFLSTLVAILIWVFTKNPLWSVILITVIDTVAFVPMFRKAYHHPETESPVVAVFAAVKFIFGIAALNSYTVVTVLFPLVTVITNVAFALMILHKRRGYRVDQKSVL